MEEAHAQEASDFVSEHQPAEESLKEKIQAVRTVQKNEMRKLEDPKQEAVEELQRTRDKLLHWVAVQQENVSKRRKEIMP